MIKAILKPFSFVPALLLMYMIYSFSAQTGDVSSQLSYKVSYKIVETVDQALDANMESWEIDTWVYRIHGLVRKLAHMTEYFALAVAVAFPLYVYGVHGIWLMLLAGLICVGFACGDEYHQSFVEGRGPSSRDVAIDSFGVFWGIILVRIVGWTGRKTIFRPTKKQLAKKERKAQMKAAKKAAKKEQKAQIKAMKKAARHGGQPIQEPQRADENMAFFENSQHANTVPSAGNGQTAKAANSGRNTQPRMSRQEFEHYDELLYQNQTLSGIPAQEFQSQVKNTYRPQEDVTYLENPSVQHQSSYMHQQNPIMPIMEGADSQQSSFEDPASGTTSAATAIGAQPQGMPQAAQPVYANLNSQFAPSYANTSNGNHTQSGLATGKNARMRQQGQRYERHPYVGDYSRSNASDQ